MSQFDPTFDLIINVGQHYISWFDEAILMRTHNINFMENYRKLSFNYHQIPSLSVSLTSYSHLHVAIVIFCDDFLSFLSADTDGDGVMDGGGRYYHKFPKYSDSRKIAVIILKLELCGPTIE